MYVEFPFLGGDSLEVGELGVEVGLTEIDVLSFLWYQNNVLEVAVKDAKVLFEGRRNIGLLLLNFSISSSISFYASANSYSLYICNSGRSRGIVPPGIGNW